MTRWKVGLSNGENFTEGNAPFEAIANEDSPWLKLQKYLAENELKITSLSLIDGSRTFNLPSLGNNPKFQAFYTDVKPVSYNFGRPFSISSTKKQELFARIQAVYSDVILELWVDENRTDNCWVNITEVIKNPGNGI